MPFAVLLPVSLVKSAVYDQNMPISQKYFDFDVFFASSNGFGRSFVDICRKKHFPVLRFSTRFLSKDRKYPRKARLSSETPVFARYREISRCFFENVLFIPIFCRKMS